MIEFRDVSKGFSLHGEKKQVLADATFALPEGRHVAVIGSNGAGKSTLINLMSGALRPDRGSVRRSGRVSWPLAFGGGFHPMLTGRQNAEFVARIYQVEVDPLVEEVREFAELGASFDLPVRTYSQGMRSRLAFGVSMSINFDCYLVDEIIGVGDTRFREKCRTAFREKLKDAQVIMASHSESGLKEMCQSALWVEDGQVTFFDALDDGLEAYHANQRGAGPQSL